MILQKEASIRIKICIIGTFLWGILAHGIMLFNKISFHDDAGLYRWNIFIRSLDAWSAGKYQ